MEKGLTKMQSKIIYGIAILMMIYHHLFCLPERLNNDYISILNFNGINLEERIAWFCKLCVALYAFISGYGMYLSANKKKFEKVEDKLIYDIKFSIKHLIKFYFKFSIVFLIFIPLGYIFFNIDFNIKELIKNYLTISHSYNGEWWYIRAYIYMLILFPFLDVLMCKIKDKNSFKIKSILIILPCLFIAIILKFNILDVTIKDFFNLHFMYILCFIVGYLFSQFNIYGKIENIIKKYKKMDLIISIISLLMLIYIRNKFAIHPRYNKLDFIIAPIFIYSILTIIKYIDKKHIISKILIYFGNYNTFIWLTHTFYCYYYFQSIILKFKYSIFIYLITILISLITSILLNYICNWLYKIISDKSKKIINKFIFMH